MSDSPEATPANPRRRMLEWRRSVRWFAAEFAVVVVGILVAIAVNAWWEDRQDRAREQEYLQQLAGDLQETERLMAVSDSLNRPWTEATAALVRAYRQPTQPPDEAVFRWLDGVRRYDNPVPIFATAEALVTTGDLRLVREKDLRAAILSWLSQSRDYWVDPYLYQLEQEHREAVSAFHSSVDPYEVLSRQRPRAELDSLARFDLGFPLPEGPYQEPFPLDVAALLRERDAYHALSTVHSKKVAMQRYRREAGLQAQVLRQQVEAASGQ